MFLRVAVIEHENSVCQATSAGGPSVDVDLRATGEKACPGSPQDPYDRCFLLPILGAEQAFYPWDRASRWEKRVQLEDIRDAPREAYVDNLMKAAKSGNWQQVDGLSGEECRKVLTEMRQTWSRQFHAAAFAIGL
jgi:hypothetical protein